MGNDDEVAAVKEAVNDVDEAFDVGFVQRGIDFVQDRVGRRAGLENGHEQRDRGHGFLAAGELRKGTRFFARWFGGNLDAGFEDIDIAVFIRLEEDIGLAAAEETTEEALRPGEVLADLVECFFEAGARVVVDLLDQLTQLSLGFFDVLDLVGQLVLLVFELVLFVDRAQVDVTEAGDLALEFFDGVGGELPVDVEGDLLGFGVFLSFPAR